uniref:Phosphoinositide phospholipase C n=1 Tax=Meloidogyne hapla TaxID=6305 RepID=A0A1I8BPM6_MELHA
MVALNFQTADVAMAVNTAMFEQTGNCGYILKPRALWDANHPLFGKFNPYSKEITSCPAIILQLTIISGQYVSPGSFSANPILEIEIIGVPVDCVKEKSKSSGGSGRNSVNPIWNHSSTFRIVFVELAFLRIAVCDGDNGKVLSQRVVPVRCLRPGYRHLPLRTPNNQPLEQSLLFIRTRFEQEEHIYLHEEDHPLPYGAPYSAQHSPHSACSNSQPHSGSVSMGTNNNYEPEMLYQVLKIDPEANVKPLFILRRQIFIIRILGLFPDDTTSIVVHAESSSTVRSVIAKALSNAGKQTENPEDYILFEENIPSIPVPPNSTSPSASASATALSSVYPLDASANIFGQQSSSTSETNTNFFSASTSIDQPSKQHPQSQHRILPHNEPILDAVMCWNGASRRFHLRKKNVDPATGRSSLFSAIMKGGGISQQQQSPHHQSPLAPRKSLGQGADDSCGTKSPSGTVHLTCRSSVDVIEPSGANTGESLEPGMHPRAKSMGETFIVCIHNISDNHPYAILRTSVNNTAKDVINQIFAKTQRFDIKLEEYALIEEVYSKEGAALPHNTAAQLAFGGGKKSVGSGGSSAPVRYRMLDPDENIWKIQSRWTSGSGRFLLEKRDQVPGKYFDKSRKPSERPRSPLFYYSMPSCAIPSVSGSNSPVTGITIAQPFTKPPSHHASSSASTPLRKISLSNMRPIQIQKRISRFGKSFTLDSSANRHKDSLERS